MKDLVGSFGSFLRQVTGGTAAMLLLLSLQAQGQNTLNNYNSTVNLNLNGSGSNPPGIYSWSATTTANQWFWFRVGNSAEAPINTISAPYVNQTLAKLLTVTYSNQSYAVQITYNLTGSPTPGSDYSGLSEGIKVSNFTASALDFHFFEYAAIGLGNAGSETVNLSSQSASTQVLQSYNGRLFNASVSPFAASHFQAGNDGSILASLNDGLPTTLTGAASATGNVNWALQWDFSIPAGSTAQLSQLMTVPEPSSMALLLVGAAGILYRRRH